MRFTVVDGDGIMSFVAPCHALKMLAAACSRRPADHRQLISLAGEYDAQLADDVLAGLSVFDELNTRSNVQAIRTRLQDGSVHHAPPFRVLDEVTRRQSLQPARAGLIVINLPAKRIVQVQNRYAELRRRDRGRIRRGGRPVGAMYSYELPTDWSIVP